MNCCRTSSFIWLYPSLTMLAVFSHNDHVSNCESSVWLYQKTLAPRGMSILICGRLRSDDLRTWSRRRWPNLHAQTEHTTRTYRPSSSIRLSAYPSSVVRLRPSVDHLIVCPLFVYISPSTRRSSTSLVLSITSLHWPSIPSIRHPSTSSIHPVCPSSIYDLLRLRLAVVYLRPSILVCPSLVYIWLAIKFQRLACLSTSICRPTRSLFLLVGPVWQGTTNQFILTSSNKNLMLDSC